jgi:hypothetical protein
MTRLTARSIALSAVCASLVIAGGVGTASAGEVTGNGKPVTVKAKSACAFSGLEDWVSSAPQPVGGLDVHPGVVQNWGHVKKAAGLTGGANSVQSPFGEEGCNAHLYPNR